MVSLAFELGASTLMVPRGQVHLDGLRTVVVGEEAVGTVRSGVVQVEIACVHGLVNGNLPVESGITRAHAELVVDTSLSGELTLQSIVGGKGSQAFDSGESLAATVGTSFIGISAFSCVDIKSNFDLNTTFETDDLSRGARSSTNGSFHGGSLSLSGNLDSVGSESKGSKNEGLHEEFFLIFKNRL